MSQNFGKMFWAYISTFYILTKLFRGKTDNFCVACEKDKIWCCKGLFTRHFFVFFTQTTKNAGFM